MGQRLDILLHVGDVMNAEEIHKALIQPISVETRLDWLEARLDRIEDDARGARAAILKLERDVRWHRVALWAFLPYFAGLSLLLAWNWPVQP